MGDAERYAMSVSRKQTGVLRKHASVSEQERPCRGSRRVCVGSRREGVSNLGARDAVVGVIGREVRDECVQEAKGCVL